MCQPLHRQCTVHMSGQASGAGFTRHGVTLPNYAQNMLTVQPLCRKRSQMAKEWAFFVLPWSWSAVQQGISSTWLSLCAPRFFQSWLPSACRWRSRSLVGWHCAHIQFSSLQDQQHQRSSLGAILALCIFTPLTGTTDRRRRHSLHAGLMHT